MTEPDCPSSQVYVNQPCGLAPEESRSRSFPTMIGLFIELAHGKWFIARATGGALLIGLVTCFLLPVRYTGTAKIMTPQRSQSTAAMMLMSQMGSAGAGSLAASAAGDLLRNPNDLYIGLLTSRPVADALIDKFALVREYHSRDMTAARKELAERTHIASEKSGLIGISVEDGEKSRAADMANAYTDQLRALTQTLAVTEAARRRLFYEDQLKQARDHLTSAEMAFQQVQQGKGIIQLDSQTKAMIQGLAELRAEVTAKEVQLQAVRSYSTERNPDVQIDEQELSSLQGQVTRLEEKSNSDGPGDIALGDVPSAGTAYLNAEHDLQYHQILFDLILKQYDAAKLDEAKDAAIIQVVEPAILPDRKSSPQRTVIVAWITVLGLLGSCSYLLLRDSIRKRPEISGSLAALKSAFLRT